MEENFVQILRKKHMEEERLHNPLAQLLKVYPMAHTTDETRGIAATLIIISVQCSLLNIVASLCSAMPT
jgi:hypothetical protein